MVADKPAEGGAVEAEEFKLPLDCIAENVIRPQNSLTGKKSVVSLGEYKAPFFGRFVLNAVQVRTIKNFFLSVTALFRALTLFLESVSPVCLFICMETSALR